MRRTIVSTVAVVLLAGGAVNAAQYTVCQSGDCNYKSIQAAVDKASVNDEVVIMDTAVYDEQVTIDSTKKGLVLRSQTTPFDKKPTIRYQDKVNVGPRNSGEAMVDSMINFYTNGTVRILYTSNVRIEGIAIDGGGVYPFGSDGIWEGKYALQHGNAALCLVTSGDAIIRYCEIRNAYFGCYVYDANIGGIYALPTAVGGESAANRGPLTTGNHLFEHNRIHDNSVGMQFENGFDMGSTIRYNLMYENHHPTTAIATKVKSLTSEGGNQTGGAFVFKNQMLSPLAIYNNTLWHNSLLFVGNWKAGGIHLIFNNIFAEPNEYWGNSSTTFATSFDMSKCFANRMHNCIYAAQQQAPTPNYTTITNDLKPQTTGATYREGALISPFPANAEVRWVEPVFKSLDPESDDFLVPNWDDPEVAQYIIDKGWEAAGVKDPNGTRADLGAISAEGGAPVDITTLRPAEPVVVIGDTALISFYVSTRFHFNEMTNAKATLFGLVRNLDTADVFGSSYKPIPSGNIISIPLNSYDVVAGIKNIIRVPVAELTGNFSFFEVIVEGTGSNMKPYTSAVGFIPYRKDEPYVKIELLNADKTAPLEQIRCEVTFVVRISFIIDRIGTLFDKQIDSVEIGTGSGMQLLTPGAIPITRLPDGITGVAEVKVVVIEVPKAGVDNIFVTGTTSDLRYATFYGSSNTIKVLPPYVSIMPGSAIVQPMPGKTLVELIDLSGRVVARREIGTGVADHVLRTFRLAHSRGVYLVKLTDIKSGRVVTRRMVAAGR